MCSDLCYSRIHPRLLSDTIFRSGLQWTSQSTTTYMSFSSISLTHRLSFRFFTQGVINVHMAKAPSTVANWDGSGSVWFKVAQLSAITDGGKAITFPADNATEFKFKIPKTLPNGEYLVRIGMSPFSFFQLLQANSHTRRTYCIA